jgi:hypothetical protein
MSAPDRARRRVLREIFDGDFFSIFYGNVSGVRQKRRDVDSNHTFDVDERFSWPFLLTHHGL